MKKENKSGFTPGPWRVDLNPYDNEYRVYTDGPGSYPVINSLFKPSGDDGLATATLIASAPDMLDALYDAAERLENIAVEIRRGNLDNAVAIAKNNARYMREAIGRAKVV